MTRLETLNNRREKLIKLNSIYQYSVAGHAKIAKYYDCMLRIKKEIFSLENCNFRPINARIGLTIKDLFNLKNPIK